MTTPFLTSTRNLENVYLHHLVTATASKEKLEEIVKRRKYFEGEGMGGEGKGPPAYMRVVNKNGDMRISIFISTRNI